MPAAVAACAALTLWAFLGLESATVPAGDVVEPERTIPRATIIGVSLAAAVYIVITVVAFGVVPLADLQGNTAPLAEVATIMWGTIGGTFVAIAAGISTFGTLNGFTMLTGQVPLGAAQDDLFPRQFGKLSKAKTPVFALVVSNILASILIAMNFTKGLVDQFVFIILLATLTTLVPYLFCALAEFMIYLTTGRTVAGRRLGPVLGLAAVGFIYSAWAIYGAWSRYRVLRVPAADRRRPGLCLAEMEPSRSISKHRNQFGRIDMTGLGVHSEVGKLRKVIVHRPGMALSRLTPSNREELLFDDVIWVKQARIEHHAFADIMRHRDIDVLFVRELLEETMRDMEARKWLLDRKIRPEVIGIGLSQDLHPALMEMDAQKLSNHLIGGMNVSELPFEPPTGLADVMEPYDFVIRPLPNQLFTRDPSAWIYGGVTLHPMYWPARRQETLNMAAIYKFNPMFKEAEFEFWFGDDVDHDYGMASVEGGDVMPIGNKTVLIGVSERTSRQGAGLFAQGLFAKGGAERVIACVMPRERAYMHLDTVFTLCDRDLANLFPGVVHGIKAISLRPGDREGEIEVTAEKENFLTVVEGALGWGAASFGRSPPAAMPMSRSASSGMTATTSWPWSPAWSLPMSATPTPTRCCARPASR